MIEHIYYDEDLFLVDMTLSGAGLPMHGQDRIKDLAHRMPWNVTEATEAAVHIAHLWNVGMPEACQAITSPEVYEALKLLGPVPVILGIPLGSVVGLIEVLIGCRRWEYKLFELDCLWRALIRI